MSKNMTRKGLALGAVVALGSTVIAGTPAFAAGELVVAPAVGTSYTTLVTETFNLKTTFAPGFTPSSYAQLKYQVVTDGTDVNLTTGAALQTVTNVDAATAFTGDADNTTVVASTNATAVSVNYLGINLDGAASTATSTSVAVTAFVDANNDGALTAGEWNSTQTVAFKNFADSGATLALTAPAEGQTTATGTLSFTSGVNTAALTSALVLKFDDNATTPAALLPAGVGLTGTLAFTGLTTTADANGVLSATTGALTAFTSTTKVGLSATLAGTAIGTRQTATAAAFAIAAPTAAVVTGSNGLATGNKARLNSAFAVAASITDTAAVAKSGVAVSAVVSGLPTLSATKTVAINGVVYNGTVAVPSSFALTSDAAGKATLNFVTVGFVAADDFSVAFTANNRPTATVAVDNVVPSYTVVSSAIGSAERSIVEGGSATFNYVVKDDFGVAIAAGSRLKVVVGYTTPVTSYVAITDGKASVTVTDTTASTDADITVAAGLQTQDTATSNWAPDTTTVNAATQTVNVTATAVAFDGTPAAASVAMSTNVSLTGVSVNNPGAAVTIASKGVTFTVDSVEYVDTVTVYSASSTGHITVSAKSDIAGAHTVTYTAGSVSQTAVLTIAAAPSNTGVTLSVVSANKVKSGSTLVVTGLLVDKFGNPVAVTHAATSTPASTDRGFVVTYDGPGFVIGSLPTSTDANGKFTFRVLLGAGDTGAATTTVSYDVDGGYASLTTTPATSAAAITKSVTSLIGVSATATAAKKAASVVVKNAAGLSITVVSGTKSVTKIATSDSYKVSLTKLTAGKKTVKVYVEDILVLSKSVTVKK
jgi:hypothetical protein